MTGVKLPQYSWDEPREIEYPLPDSWRVTVNNFAGSDRPAASPEAIRAAITSPIGMPPLRETARGKKEVVILFDDMTRSTRTSRIVPYVLEELAEAGITDDRIRFIAAVANHQALDRASLAKKLGEDIVARFPVYNHCPFLNCTEVGTTSYGTKAFINSEVMHCDLKIAIGSILPHVQYGFSGGSKMVIPGVASYETVVAHHGVTHEAWKGEQRKAGRPFIGMTDNPMQADAREIADMVGLDMLINCTVNKWGETVAVFAGAMEPTYRAAIEEARGHYTAAASSDNDIVIANTYVKASEYNMAFSTLPAVNRQGGDLVIIANSPLGQVVHYLFDMFGKTISGRGRHTVLLAPHIRNLIIHTEFPEGRLMERYAAVRDRVLMTADWNEVIERLQKSNKADAKVAVYPNADTQYFPM